MLIQYMCVKCLLCAAYVLRMQDKDLRPHSFHCWGVDVLHLTKASGGKALLNVTASTFA